MPTMHKPPVTYAPRGVTKKVIALRLLAPELAKHESLAKQNGSSSASFAREMYLRGMESYQLTASSPLAACGMNTTSGVNRA